MSSTDLSSRKRLGIASQAIAIVVLAVSSLGILGATAWNAHVSSQTSQQINNVISGPGAKESRQLALWYAEELESVCAATTNCHTIPLPSFSK